MSYQNDGKRADDKVRKRRQRWRDAAHPDPIFPELGDEPPPGRLRSGLIARFVPRPPGR